MWCNSFLIKFNLPSIQEKQFSLFNNQMKTILVYAIMKILHTLSAEILQREAWISKYNLPTPFFFFFSMNKNLVFIKNLTFLIGMNGTLLLILIFVISPCRLLSIWFSYILLVDNLDCSLMHLKTLTCIY